MAVRKKTMSRDQLVKAGQRETKRRAVNKLKATLRAARKRSDNKKKFSGR